MSFQNWHKEFQKFWSEHLKVSKFHFNGILLNKVYIVWAKKVQRSYLSWNWRGIQNLEGNRLFIQNWHKEFDRFWPEHSKVSNHFHFKRLLLSKVYIVWAKKVQKSYLSWNWRGIQNFERNRLSVWEMTSWIWQNFTRALESVKIGTLIGSFCPKWKMYELKIYRRVMCHDMKRNKIEEEPTCHFKIGMRNLTNFDPSTWKSKKFVLIHFLSPKYITFGLQKYIGIIFHKELCNLWRENGLWFEKWHEKFSRFSPEHFKVSKLGLRCDPFVEGRKGLTLKFTEDLCAMTMKNNSKCEEELTCHFKTDMRNLTNFDSSTRKSKKIAL